MPSYARFASRLLCLATLLQPLFAHGGQYRGPANVVPSSPSSQNQNNSGGSGSGSGSSSTSRSGSGTSSSSGTTSTGPSTPASPSSGALGGKVRGAALDDDLGRWEFWWEFGKDPYLRLRDAIYGGSGGVQIDDALLNPALQLRPLRIERPTPADLDRVVAALFTTLKQAQDRDTITGCLVALAKIGRDSPRCTLQDAFVPLLASGDQEQRETAALALGIAGRVQQSSVEILCALVRDTERAQKLSNGSSVNERTRAFAAFGLGLLLQRTPEPAAQEIVVTLLDVLATPATSGRNLKVAAIEALSLLPRDWSTDAGDTLRRSVVAGLGAYYDLDLGPGEQLMQAHVPPAIGSLLRPGDAAAETWKKRFATDLEAGLDRSGPAAKNNKVNPHIAQSCALALGVLASPWQHERDADAAIGKLLLDVYRRHRDQQTRSFAILSLARQGGMLARDALLRELDQANQAIERPWCAMALGVWSARALQAAKASGQPAAPDALVRDALRQHFATARNPSTIGALAIALGLAGDVDTADKLRASLLANRQQEDVAGYLAMALGLMRDRRALADIRTLRQESDRRPTLQMQCVRALGLLGDHTLVEELCRELEGDQTLVHLSAAAGSLGQIGDRRSIEPLLALMNRNDLAPLTRAFAAVALGGVCDKDPLPWNAAFSTCTNYRASTETLTDGAAGILDIL